MIDLKHEFASSCLTFFEITKTFFKSVSFDHFETGQTYSISIHNPVANLLNTKDRQKLHANVKCSVSLAQLPLELDLTTLHSRLQHLNPTTHFHFNPLTANLIKWPNTLRCLSVFNHFVGLVLKVLKDILTKKACSK